MNVNRSFGSDNDGLGEQQIAQSIESIRSAFWRNLEHRSFKNTPLNFHASFISNHDLDRLSLATKGSQNRLKIAASLLLASPGVCFLYYGEEIGMQQFAPYDDMYKRGIMHWDSSPSAGFNISGKRWLDLQTNFPWNKNFIPWWSNYWKQNLSNDNIKAASSDTIINIQLLQKINRA